jgi:hypothetical protein
MYYSKIARHRKIRDYANSRKHEIDHLWNRVLCTKILEKEKIVVVAIQGTCHNIQVKSYLVHAEY